MRELLYINKIITNFYLETLDPNNYQHITIYYLQKMCVCVWWGGEESLNSHQQKIPYTLLWPRNLLVEIAMISVQEERWQES